jgi:hypothetical protein
MVENESIGVRSGDVFDLFTRRICFHAAMILKSKKTGRCGLPLSRAEGNSLD